MSFSSQEVVVVGWHDGIIECFVQGDDGRWTYASMVAWDPGRKLRIFGIVAADAPTVSEVRSLCSESDSEDSKGQAWERIRARVSKFLRTVDGEAELVLCDQIDGEIKATWRIDARSLVDELGCELEEVSERTRFAFWQSKFEG